MTTRKSRKIAPAAAPVSPVAVAAAALAAVVAPDTVTVSTGSLATLDPFTVAPGDMNPATPPHRRTIGTIAAGDRPGDAVRTLSLSARFAALSVDPSPLMLDGAFLNVTQPAMSVSAPLLDGDALGYVSRPYTATRAALTVALALLDAALSVPLSGTVIPSGPLFTALTVAFAHDRAMRATRVRPAGHFDRTGVSTLDLAACATRAALRLAGRDVAGCGTRDALAASLPAHRAAVAARLAALSA